MLTTSNSRKCVALFLSAWVFVGEVHSAQPGENQLRAVLEASRAEFELPGLRAAVQAGEQPLLEVAVGVADLESNTPLTTEIGMPGGSTGKTFVAALTLLLVEEGTLSLDDLVIDWLGKERWFNTLPNAATIKVKHLLSHSSGIGDYPDTLGFNLAMVWRALRTGSARFSPEELIGYVSNKALFPAGEGFAYSDAGYLVLGRVLEAASGRSYHDLVLERVIRPLQLDQVRLQNESSLREVATGYSGTTPSVRPDGRQKFDPSSEWTGGGLITTPAMLVKFYRALAKGELVEANTLQLMIEEGFKDPTSSHHYGLGFFVIDERISHGGRWPGYRSWVFHDFSRDLTIAVQANRDDDVDLPVIMERIGMLTLDGHAAQ